MMRSICNTAFLLFGVAAAVNTGPSCIELEDTYDPLPTDSSYWPDAAGDNPDQNYLRLKDVCMASAFSDRKYTSPSYNCCPDGAKEMQCKLPKAWEHSKNNQGEKMIAYCKKRCWCNKTPKDLAYIQKKLNEPNGASSSLKAKLLNSADESTIEELEAADVLDTWDQTVANSLAATYAMICPPPEPCNSQQDCAETPTATDAPVLPSGQAAGAACTVNGVCPNPIPQNGQPVGSGGNGAAGSSGGASSSTSTNAVCTQNQMCAAVPRPRRPGPISASRVAAALIVGVRMGSRVRNVGRCVPKAPFNRFNGKRDLISTPCYCNSTFVHQDCCNSADGFVWGVQPIALDSELLL